MSQVWILVLGDISQAAIASLSGHGRLELAGQAQPTQEQLADTQIIVVRSHVQIDDVLLAGAPALELVVRAGAGLDADIRAAPELAARADLNMLLTPHIGATTTSALRRMGDEIVAAVAAFLAERCRSKADHTPCAEM